ncbi:MAG: hypothetical protein K0S60_198, partial [Evtepia sp.]|nr:hypothetical protein [Evtepia sp.]
MTGRTSKKILSIILTLAMVLSLMPVITPTASAASDTWDGGTDTSWYTSNPSATSFAINTAEELAGLATIVNAKTDNFDGDTITLGADIDLSGSSHNWIPIGNTDQCYFDGTFNGDGHVVSAINVNITGSGTSNALAGLFGGVLGDGTVKNLGVKGAVTATSNVKGHSLAGGLVGSCSGTITNCYSQVDVTSTSSVAFAFAGSLVGSTYGIVSNCYATGNVSSSGVFSSKAGVLCGAAQLECNTSYYNSDATVSGSNSNAGTPMASTDMKALSFVTILNANKEAGNSWAAVTDDYPSLAPDTTAPTISSASRTDDTHITVTLSEACQNLAQENTGGFTVTKTGMGTTCAVSKTT